MSNQHLSYDELVDHIVNNKPIPNVIHVPNIAHDESLRTKSQLQPRAKPWEANQRREPLTKEASSKTVTESGTVDSFSRAKNLETLSTYYAIETEFEQHLKNFLDGTEEDSSVQ